MNKLISSETVFLILLLLTITLEAKQNGKFCFYKNKILYALFFDADKLSYLYSLNI